MQFRKYEEEIFEDWSAYLQFSPFYYVTRRQFPGRIWFPRIRSGHLEWVNPQWLSSVSFLDTRHLQKFRFLSFLE